MHRGPYVRIDRQRDRAPSALDLRGDDGMMMDNYTARSRWNRWPVAKSGKLPSLGALSFGEEFIPASP